jgi:hypothetical protein
MYRHYFFKVALNSLQNSKPEPHNFYFRSNINMIQLNKENKPSGAEPEPVERQLFAETGD